MDSLKDKRNRVKEDLEKKGFFVNDGIKYGLDMLAYTDDPNVVHSKYGVLIFREMTFQQLISYQRICNSNNKILLMVFVEDENIKYVECERFIIKGEPTN